MRISATPWEVIWLITLLVFAISLLWSLFRQLRERKAGLPRTGLFYLSLILLLAIPATLRATNYRFKLQGSSSELTRLEHELPDLTLREYEAYNINQVYQASLKAIQSLRTYGQPWVITFAGEEQYQAGRIEAIVPVFGWQDQLTVTIQLKSGAPGIWVIVASFSPSSRPDLGENARHIKQFYDALDVELATIPP